MLTLQGTSLNTAHTKKLATVVPSMPKALTAAGKWNLHSSCRNTHSRRVKLGSGSGSGGYSGKKLDVCGAAKCSSWRY